MGIRGRDSPMVKIWGNSPQYEKCADWFPFTWLARIRDRKPGMINYCDYWSIFMDKQENSTIQNNLWNGRWDNILHAMTCIYSSFQIVIFNILKRVWTPMGSSFVRLSHCYDMLIIKFWCWIKGFAEVLNVIENYDYELTYNYENSVVMKTFFVKWLSIWISF